MLYPDYSKIQPNHFFSSQKEKTKFNWFAFELASEIDRAVPYGLKKYLSKKGYTKQKFNKSCINLAILLQGMVLKKLRNEIPIMQINYTEVERAFPNLNSKTTNELLDCTGKAWDNLLGICVSCPSPVCPIKMIIARCLMTNLTTTAFSTSNDYLIRHMVVLGIFLIRDFLNIHFLLVFKHENAVSKPQTVIKPPIRSEVCVCSFPSSCLGMGFLKFQLSEERPSRSLQDKGSQAGVWEPAKYLKCLNTLSQAKTLAFHLVMFEFPTTTFPYINFTPYFFSASSTIRWDIFAYSVKL